MAAKISAPQVIITEQPISNRRFRYKCEGRSAGTISGEFSTNENKTYPSIRILDYQGRAKVIVSCVTKDPPYRPHPHSLVGREGCNNGICVIDVPSGAKLISFSNLGIQCARRKDVDQSLDKRQKVGIDPFNTGFAHRHDPASLDMSVVCLCFQAFIEDGDGECTLPLQPVVSQPIYHIKSTGSLVICRLSECVSPVDGGKKDIYLLCKKVLKDNIKVRFYEGDEHNPTWEGFPEFLPTQVHEQTAIWFQAPPYKNLDVTEPVKVFIQLLRPSDGATSKPRPFQFLPMDAEPGMLKRKRQKFGNDPRRHILLDLQKQLQSDAASYYNIPPTPQHFTKLEPNVSLINKSISTDVTEFKFPASSTTPTSHQTNSFENLTTAPNEKLLNSMQSDNYIPTYVQNMEPSPLQFQNFTKLENTTPIVYSPLYENLSPPIHNDFIGNLILQPDLNYLNTMVSPVSPTHFCGTFNATTSTHNQVPCDSKQLTDKEKIKNAIRAKCKSLHDIQYMNNVYSVNNFPTCINQLELRNENSFNNKSHIKNYGVTQTHLQNDFGKCATNADQENLNSLLDVNFEQLENLLVPCTSDEDPYNSLNIPMDAMTISETSCNLSSLLNMDSSQLQSTINSEQLDNLLAII